MGRTVTRPAAFACDESFELLRVQVELLTRLIALGFWRVDAVDDARRISCCASLFPTGERTHLISGEISEGKPSREKEREGEGERARG